MSGSLYWLGWSAESWSSSWGDIEVFDSTASGGPDASDVARGRRSDSEERNEVEDHDYDDNFKRFVKAVYAAPVVEAEPAVVAATIVTTEVVEPETPTALHKITAPEQQIITIDAIALPAEKQQADNTLAMLLLLAEI